MKKANYFQQISNNQVKCELCPNNCKISDNRKGLCGIRYNTEAILYTETFHQYSSVVVDPIEKKPLYNFYPGAKILSLGSLGLSSQSTSFGCYVFGCSSYTPKERPSDPAQYLSIQPHTQLRSVVIFPMISVLSGSTSETRKARDLLGYPGLLFGLHIDKTWSTAGQHIKANNPQFPLGSPDSPFKTQST